MNVRNGAQSPFTTTQTVIRVRVPYCTWYVQYSTVLYSTSTPVGVNICACRQCRCDFTQSPTSRLERVIVCRRSMPVGGRSPERMDEATEEYLAENDIRAILCDAVAHVLRNRPNDPITALSDILSTISSKSSRDVQPTPFQPPSDAEVESDVPPSFVPVPRIEAHGRRRVADLMAMHESDLVALRACVCHEDHYDARRHDDLFLLRFLLTHLAKGRGGIDAAAKAATATIAWRAAHGLDDPALICGGDAALEAGPVAKFYAALSARDAISYYVPDGDRGPVLVAVPGLLDFHHMVAAMSEEEQTVAHRLSNEWLWRQCDEVTRRTGFLTKYVRLIDLNGMSLRGISRNFQKRDAKNSKAIEDYYPQLLGAVFICHAPRWMQGVWRGLRRVMPTRVVEKVDFLEPLTNAMERQKLQRWIAIENLPRCFGGACNTWPPPNARFQG